MNTNTTQGEVIKADFNTYSLQEAFPEVDPGIEPLGNRILVQIRTPRTKTKGGILLTHETKEGELWNEMTARVIKLGPLAFCNRETGLPWVEGAWCKPGEYVRVPKYGGDRIMIGDLNGADNALFVVFNDHEIISKVYCDPLSLKTHI